MNKPFVMVGRLSREKGPHLLAAIAHRTGGRSGSSVRATAREVRRLSPSSTMTGWVPRDLVREELSGARALIFPSLWYETEGLVVLEAAAMGVPAVVADSCAARDLVIDGETGLYFRGGDETALQNDDGALAGRSAGATSWTSRLPELLETTPFASITMLPILRRSMRRFYAMAKRLSASGYLRRDAVRGGQTGLPWSDVIGLGLLVCLLLPPRSSTVMKVSSFIRSCHCCLPHGAGSDGPVGAPFRRWREGGMSPKGRRGIFRCCC